MRRSNGGLFGGRNHRDLTRYNDRGNFLSLPYNTTKFSSSFTVTRIANILLLTCFLLYLLVCLSSISILFADHPNEHNTTVISPGVLMDERSNQLSASRSMENANQKYDIHEEVIWNLQTALDSSEPYVNVPIQKQREELEFIFDVKREGENDDGWDVYYARDDDEERGKREQTLYDDVEDFCTRPSFYHMYKPSCNELHSHVSGYDWMFGEDGASKKSKYLGSGTYRNVFLLEREFANKLRSKSSHETDVVIFKTMKQFKPSDKKHSFEEVTKFDPYKKYHTIELYDDMRKDAMVMELLTSSPRIANIYSFCGMSSLIEYAPGNVEKTVMPTGGKTYDELNNGLAENGYEPMDEVVDNTPVNDSIPPQEKLEIALEIAKGISTMHGHSLGCVLCC